jgi:hypothetical protein
MFSLYAAERSALRDRLRSELGGTEFDRLMAEGASLGIEAAVDRAIARDLPKG